MKRLLLFLWIICMLATNTWPCSVFNYTRDDGKTFIGRNLDWVPNAYGWIEFIQPAGGGYGVILFGADNHIWPQGGMNDQGLVLGMTATPFHDIPPDPEKLTMKLDFWEKLFTTCATVPEVLAFLDTYDLSSQPNYFEQGQMLWTDRWGNSAVHEGDVISLREGHYQMITNFCYTRPELGGYPCGRYNLMDQTLSSSTNLTEDALINLVELVHGTRWGGYTVWSLFYDPAELNVTLFYRGDFTRPLTLNLKNELQKGVLKYYMDDLFDGCVGDFEGDTIPGANSLPGCGTYQTSLECTGDTDVFTFQPSVLGTYTFETIGSTDTRLEILDSSGNLLQSDSNSGQDDNARIQLQLDNSQAYPVVIRGETPDVSGSYGLSVSGCSGQMNCGEDPADDDHRFARPIRSCQAPYAGFECPGDIDYYAFRAPGSGRYTFSTGGTSDTVIQVEDGLNRVVAYNDDYGSGRNARVEMELHAGDMVWLRISEYGNDDTGDYTMMVHGCDREGGWNTIIPAAARDVGAADTDWVSDLTVRNQGDLSATVMAEYWPQEGPPPEPIVFQLQPGAMYRHENVVETLFGQTASSGAIRLHASQPILASSRTYNRLDAGSYGQTISGVPEEEAFLSGEYGYLVGLAESDEKRTNLGFVNPSPVESQVRVTLYTSTGDILGEPTTWSVPGFSRIQINRVLNQFGDLPIEEARAKVEVMSGELFSYASIIDMLTGDPVFRLSERALGADRGLPGAARAPGEAGTLWRTELWLLSISDFQQTAILEAWPRGNRQTDKDVSITLEPGTMIHAEDAYLELLGCSEGKGTFHLTAGPEVLITGRTYNRGEEGTYGQGLTGLRPDQAITRDAAGYLIMAEENDTFRSNLGLVNPGLNSVNVNVQLIDSEGVQRGETLQWTVDAEASVQIGHVLRQFDTTLTGPAAIRITLTDIDSGNRIWAWLSVVDRVTGDAVFENASVIVPMPLPPDRRTQDFKSDLPHRPRILGVVP